MSVTDVLYNAAMFLLWMMLPFQWWSIIRNQRLMKKWEEKNADLDRLIDSYKKRLSELGKGNPFEDFE